MKPLPIVGRELRVASRRKLPYLNRVMAAGISIAMATLILISMGGRPSTMVAQFLFNFLCGFAFLYAMFAGIQFSADSISEEKREGTLGLLFLTDLNGFEIVTGKLVVHSLNAFFSLVAILPILAIPLLMGGVTLTAFRDMSLLLLNTLFYSLCAGMLASCLAKDARRTSAIAFLLVLAIVAIIPIFGLICREWKYLKALESGYWFVISPGYTWFAIISGRFPLPSSAQLIYASMAVNHALAWFFLLVAAYVLPRKWQDKPATARGMRFRERLQYWCYGNSELRSKYRKELLDVGSIYWLCARDRLKSAQVWLVLGLFAVGWTFFAFKFKQDWFSPEIYIFTAVLLHIMIKLWVASECGYQFAKDKHSGAMELLMSTPLEVRDFKRGQFRALLKQFGYPILAIFLLDCLFFVLGFKHMNTPEIDEWFWTCLIGVITLFSDLYAIYWLGMWKSVNVKNPIKLAGEVMASIMVLPGLIFIFLMMFLSSPWLRFQLDQGIVYLFWMGISLANAFWFASISRRGLDHLFRECATNPERNLGIFGTIGQWLGSAFYRR